MGGPGSGRKPMPTSRFTPELANEIIELVRQGNYLETATAACGVPVHRVREWMRQGARQKRGKYKDFSVAIKKAEAQAEGAAVVAIRAHGGRTWQALAWYLERKFPGRWAMRREVDVNMSFEEAKALTIEQLAAKLGFGEAEPKFDGLPEDDPSSDNP
jgi:hypothetical protein